MPAERFYLNDTISSGERKELKEGEYHHLVHVMRGKPGDEIEVVNGKGVLAIAKVDKIGKNSALLEILKADIEEHRIERIILAQAIPKPNRLDFILEKGTELGVDEFWLFPGHQSVKKEIYPNQLERMHAQTIAAMKQCGRLFLPEIVLKPPLAQWDAWNGTAFFGDVDINAPLFESIWKKASPIFPVLFFIGPESGFSDDEIKLLKAKGGKGVKLHQNILRTDTAALIALSLISHWMIPIR